MGVTPSPKLHAPAKIPTIAAVQLSRAAMVINVVRFLLWRVISDSFLHLECDGYIDHHATALRLGVATRLELAEHTLRHSCVVEGIVGNRGAAQAFNRDRAVRPIRADHPDRLLGPRCASHTLMENRIRLLHAGRTEKPPADVLGLLRETQERTAENDGMRLCLAISFGGQAELADAMRRIAESVKAGALAPEDIDEGTIRAHLYQPGLPDPDLLIRTAGEMRVSNFLLWQISYSEIYVSQVCWPDFRKEHLWEALQDFGRRRRKFGKVVS